MLGPAGRDAVFTSSSTNENRVAPGLGHVWFESARMRFRALPAQLSGSGWRNTADSEGAQWQVEETIAARSFAGAAEVALSWSKGGSASREIREQEHELECRVSTYIGTLPVLWLDVPDAPGTNSLRRTLERRSIALLSGLSEPSPDRPLEAWLGLHSPRAVIRESGLWNVDHLSEPWNADFLETLNDAIQRM